MTIDDETSPRASVNNGDAVRQRSAIDARKSGGPLEDGSDKRSDLALLRILVPRQFELHRNDIVRIQAQGNVLQVHDRADSESGHDQQQHRHRNLGDHQSLKDPVVTNASGESRTGILKNLVERRSGHVPRRQQREQERSE